MKILKILYELRKRKNFPFLLLSFFIHAIVLLLPWSINLYSPSYQWSRTELFDPKGIDVVFVELPREPLTPSIPVLSKTVLSFRPSIPLSEEKTHTENPANIFPTGLEPKESSLNPQPTRTSWMMDKASPTITVGAIPRSAEFKAVERVSDGHYVTLTGSTRDFPMQKWLSLKMKYGKDVKIDLVFAIDIWRNVPEKMPATKNYILDFLGTLEEDMDVALGLIRLSHPDGESFKVYGLTENRAEFINWLDDMADVESDRNQVWQTGRREIVPALEEIKHRGDAQRLNAVIMDLERDWLSELFIQTTHYNFDTDVGICKFTYYFLRPEEISNYFSNQKNKH